MAPVISGEFDIVALERDKSTDCRNNGQRHSVDMDPAIVVY